MTFPFASRNHALLSERKHAGQMPRLQPPAPDLFISCGSRWCGWCATGVLQVFGQVIDGYSVVKAIEAVGSRSGDTAEDVVIADCGVVASAALAAPARRTRRVKQQPPVVRMMLSL